MDEYQIYDAGPTLALAFMRPVLFDKNPLPLKVGDLIPGMSVLYLGGNKTSAFFQKFQPDEPVEYCGLFHSFRQEGELACFRNDNMKPIEPWVEWYYALHWLPENQEFMVTNSKSLNGRVYETDNALIR